MATEKENSLTVEDRAAGAIMGAMIGDALGLGCHWYYNLDQLRSCLLYTSDAADE